MIEDVMKLMIVDDEELLTKLLRKIVESSFSGIFAIKTFNDSELAANYIIEENPSIVITDLIMPKIDGQEILRIAKKQDKGIKVIVATADKTLTSSINCFMEGADNYVCKPIQPDDVIRAVNYCKQGLEHWNKIIKGKVRV